MRKTIADKVYEFLMDSDKPKHISEILDFVKIYRTLNERRVIEH